MKKTLLGVPPDWLSSWTASMICKLSVSAPPGLPASSVKLPVNATTTRPVSKPRLKK